jgi:hypothetical protein
MEARAKAWSQEMYHPTLHVYTDEHGIVRMAPKHLIPASASSLAHLKLSAAPSGASSVPVAPPEPSYFDLTLELSKEKAKSGILETENRELKAQIRDLTARLTRLSAASPLSDIEAAALEVSSGGRYIQTRRRKNRKNKSSRRQ